MRRALSSPELSIVVALALVVAVFGAIRPGVFLSWDNLNSILVAAAVLMILAVAQTFVVVTAGIDLSINANVILSAIVFGWIFDHGHGVALGIAAALTAGLAVGVTNGVIITRGRVADFIAALGMLSVAPGLTLLISDAEPVTVFNRFFTALATGSLGPVRWMVLVALVV